jgi:hypothetical protein
MMTNDAGPNADTTPSLSGLVQEAYVDDSRALCVSVVQALGVTIVHAHRAASKHANEAATLRPNGGIFV